MEPILFQKKENEQLLYSQNFILIIYEIIYQDINKMSLVPHIHESVL